MSKLISVLSNVCANRLAQLKTERTIKLTQLMGEYLVDEVNQTLLPKDKQLSKNVSGINFQLNLLGEFWSITTDPIGNDYTDDDIQEEIYKSIQLK